MYRRYRRRFRRRFGARRRRRISRPTPTRRRRQVRRKRIVGRRRVRRGIAAVPKSRVRRAPRRARTVVTYYKIHAERTLARTAQGDNAGYEFHRFLADYRNQNSLADYEFYKPLSCDVVFERLSIDKFASMGNWITLQPQWTSVTAGPDQYYNANVADSESAGTAHRKAMALQRYVKDYRVYFVRPKSNMRGFEEWIDALNSRNDFASLDHTNLGEFFNVVASWNPFNRGMRLKGLRPLVVGNREIYKPQGSGCDPAVGQHNQRFFMTAPMERCDRLAGRVEIGALIVPRMRGVDGTVLAFDQHPRMTFVWREYHWCMLKDPIKETVNQTGSLCEPADT